MFDPAGAPVRAETGDVSRGETVFKQCRSCHMVGAEARHRVGPHLNGIFGRQAAALEDYDYSKAFRRAGADGLVWTAESLDRYLENPKAMVSRSRMQFRGVKHGQDRSDLLAYLRQFSDNPRDIPESAPTVVGDPPLDPTILLIVGDPAYGEYLSGECVTCHQQTGADQGIPSITGWPTPDFVVAMHAYKKKARVHPVMQMIAGRLSEEEIAALAAYFETLKQE
ncbi:MAG: c-type cytochrome [Alphaproteobacteria bacterium]|nr:c-type cytochrome [Alphaproteobacteria bacterium]